MTPFKLLRITCHHDAGNMNGDGIIVGASLHILSTSKKNLKNAFTRIFYSDVVNFDVDISNINEQAFFEISASAEEHTSTRPTPYFYITKIQLLV